MPHVYKEFLMLLGLAVVLICFALCIRHKVRCWNAEFRQKVTALCRQCGIDSTKSGVLLDGFYPRHTT